RRGLRQRPPVEEIVLRRRAPGRERLAVRLLHGADGASVAASSGRSYTLRAPGRPRAAGPARRARRRGPGPVFGTCRHAAGNFATSIYPIDGHHLLTGLSMLSAPAESLAALSGLQMLSLLPSCPPPAHVPERGASKLGCKNPGKHASLRTHQPPPPSVNWRVRYSPTDFEVPECTTNW